MESDANIDMFSKKTSFANILILSSIVLNSLSLILGLIYLTVKVYSIFWEIFDILLILNLAINFVLIYWLKLKINKKTPIGKRLNILIYAYLAYSALALLFMNFGNLLISMSYENGLTNNLFANLLVYLGYFGMFGLGWYLSFIAAMERVNKELWSKEADDSVLIVKKSMGSKIAKYTIISLSYFGLAICIITSVTILFGVQIGHTFGYWGVAASQFALSWGLVIASCTIIILIGKTKKNLIHFYSISALGLVLVIITLLPMLSMPFSSYQAGKNFDNAFNPAFGGNWEEQISPEIEAYFLQSPYYLTQYFLGVEPKDCVVLQDILYFNGSESSFSVDYDILLYFDAYLPLNGGVGLPGENSTIIRIHGGGWSIGDKGRSNMLQMNKYFAAQGYIVFDIQYGLRESDRFKIITPENVQGNFTRDDMVRHIGNFTQYLGNHAAEYGANLSSVFVSGGSAGGQLASITALGISSGLNTSIFGSSLTIKGLIPFYPANRIYEETDVYDNPALLVDINSPACLIFQGTQDGLVKPEVSEALLQAYLDKGNTNCSIIYLLFAGHASDLYFSGNYNQLFLYFMERFLYLFH